MKDLNNVGKDEQIQTPAPKEEKEKCQYCLDFGEYHGCPICWKFSN